LFNFWYIWNKYWSNLCILSAELSQNQIIIDQNNRSSQSDSDSYHSEDSNNSIVDRIKDEVMILFNKHIISKPIFSVILIMDAKLRDRVENDEN
jgi:hypothetical protein